MKNDIYQAKCNACGDAVNITSGIGAVKNYENTPKHLRNFNNNKNQLHFVVKEKGTVSMESVDKSVILTTEEQKWKAEILRALNLVDKNHSFESCKEHNMLYSNMFHDSEIAKNYEMSATKVMYLMKHGIAVYAKNDVNNDISGKPFTFHFDESTNQHVKKQYDVYVTFYSTIEKSIVTAYCGALLVGRCSSPDLLNHFYKFFEENYLNVKPLLNVGMDGPNVNLAFKNLLIDDLTENHKTTFIYLGTCALHTANNTFGKLMKELSEIVDLDQVAIDFHFFFKYGRRENFRMFQT